MGDFIVKTLRLGIAVQQVGVETELLTKSCLSKPRATNRVEGRNTRVWWKFLEGLTSKLSFKLSQCAKRDSILKYDYPNQMLLSRSNSRSFIDISLTLQLDLESKVGLV